MKTLSWILIAIGGLIQILIPGQIIVLENKIVLGLPLQFGVSLIGYGCAVLGFILLYFAWFRGYAKKIDNRTQS